MSRSEDWNHCSNFNKIYNPFLAFIWLVCVISVVTFLWSFFKQLYSTANGISGIFRRLSTSLCICAVVSAVSQGSYYTAWSLYCHNIISSIISKNMTYHIGIAVGSCASTFYSFSLVLLLAIFLIRLRNTFQDTTYDLSHRIYIIVMIFIAIDFILGPIGTFIINYGRQYTTIGDSSFAIGSAIIAMHFLLYVIIAFYLLFLFVRSLLSVSSVNNSAQSYRGSRTTSTVSISVTQQRKFTESNLHLIPTITKYL